MRLDSKKLIKAKKEFKFVMKNDNQWQKNAQLHFSVIEKEEELNDFEEIMRAYKNENYDVVSDLSEKYVVDHPQSEFIIEIREILNISLKKKKLEKYKRKSKNILLYQLAEREYLKSNYSKAMEHIDELIKSTTDTTMRQKAELLKYKITQVKKLSEIETVKSDKTEKFDLDVIKSIK